MQYSYPKLYGTNLYPRSQVVSWITPPNWENDTHGTDKLYNKIENNTIYIVIGCS